MHTDDYLTVNAVLHGDKDGYGQGERILGFRLGVSDR